jgi:hypothetical protein
VLITINMHSSIRLRPEDYVPEAASGSGTGLARARTAKAKAKATAGDSFEFVVIIFSLCHSCR